MRPNKMHLQLLLRMQSDLHRQKDFSPNVLYMVLALDTDSFVLKPVTEGSILTIFCVISASCSIMSRLNSPSK
jgi:hypothetical protein